MLPSPYNTMINPHRRSSNPAHSQLIAKSSEPAHIPSITNLCTCYVSHGESADAFLIIGMQRHNTIFCKILVIQLVNTMQLLWVAAVGCTEKVTKASHGLERHKM